MNIPMKIEMRKKLHSDLLIQETLDIDNHFGKSDNSIIKKTISLISSVVGGTSYKVL